MRGEMSGHGHDHNGLQFVPLLPGWLFLNVKVLMENGEEHLLFEVHGATLTDRRRGSWLMRVMDRL